MHLLFSRMGYNFLVIVLAVIAVMVSADANLPDHHRLLHGEGGITKGSVGAVRATTGSPDAGGVAMEVDSSHRSTHGTGAVFGDIVYHSKRKRRLVDAYRPGQIMLAGLFPVHGRAADPSGTRLVRELKCSKLNRARGVQRVEAMRYAVDRINNSTHILPRHRLGYAIYDTCSESSRGHDIAMQMTLEVYDGDHNQHVCVPSSDHLGSSDKNGSASEDILSESPTLSSALLGVIGGSLSSVSAEVAEVLRFTQVPQISYASTSEALSHKDVYPYFLRTVPPDSLQARALADIVIFFNWTYISTVHSAGQYGESGIEAFFSALDKSETTSELCYGVRAELRGSNHAIVLQNLLDRPQARVVVLFVKGSDAREFLKVAEAMYLDGDTSIRQALQQFVWIASDGWGDQPDVVRDVHEVAAGALTLEMTSVELPGFKSYFTDLRPDSEPGSTNPWFSEYWNGERKCKHTYNRKRPPMTASLMDDPSTANNVSRSTPKVNVFTDSPVLGQSPCTEEAPDFDQESKIPFVYTAVYALASAIHEEIEACDGCTDPVREIKREDVRNRLMNSVFTDENGFKIGFDKNGDGPGSYNILNVQPSPEGKGKYEYRPVGVWTDNGLKLHTERIFWGPIYHESHTDSDAKEGNNSYSGDTIGWVGQASYSFNASSVSMERRLHDISFRVKTAGVDGNPAESSFRYPLSYCSDPCELGSKRVDKSPCCWECIPCSKNQFTPDPHTCEDCPEFSNATADWSGCQPLPTLKTPWVSAIILAPLILGAAGILFTIVIGAIFIHYRDTPIIRASGRETAGTTLIGCAICYTGPYVILAADPSEMICGLRRIVVAIGPTLIYASLFTKTVRIYRVFRHLSPQGVSYTAPKWQLIQVVLLTFLHTIITGVWMGAEHPNAAKILMVLGRGREANLAPALRCTAREEVVVASLGISAILIVANTALSMGIRRAPSTFNEAKMMGLTMYATSALWLCFIPFYFAFSANYQYQEVALAVSVCLCAVTVQGFLFGQKIFVILFMPEKNRKGPATKKGIRTELKAEELARKIIDNEQVIIPRHSGIPSSDGERLLQNGSMESEAEQPCCSRTEPSTSQATQSIEASCQTDKLPRHSVVSFKERKGSSALSPIQRKSLAPDNVQKDDADPVDNSIEIDMVVPAAAENEDGTKVPICSFCKDCPLCDCNGIDKTSKETVADKSGTEPRKRKRSMLRRQHSAHLNPDENIPADLCYNILVSAGVAGPFGPPEVSGFPAGFGSPGGEHQRRSSWKELLPWNRRSSNLARSETPHRRSSGVQVNFGPYSTPTESTVEPESAHELVEVLTDSGEPGQTETRVCLRRAMAESANTDRSESCQGLLEQSDEEHDIEEENIVEQVRPKTKTDISPLLETSL